MPLHLSPGNIWIFPVWGGGARPHPVFPVGFSVASVFSPYKGTAAWPLGGWSGDVGWVEVVTAGLGFCAF